MYLKHLSLTNYRNYGRLEQDLPQRTILVQGDNAQGKTNLLEAIYYLATTRSPIIGADRYLLSWSTAEEPMPFARVVGTVERAGREERIEITLLREGPGEGRLMRHFRLNGVDRRAVDLLGRLNVVLFLPQDIDLVAGAPALRRRYLDATLCQVDPAYTRHLQRYNRVLEQRNSLLRRLREGHDDPSQLAYWDEQLARWGALITARRAEAVRRLQAEAAAIHPELTGGAEQLTLRYEASLHLPEPPEEQRGLAPDEPPPAMLEAALACLRQSRPRDLASAVTNAGPHRDELRFLAGGVDMGLLGSRGQQRTVALALKLAEVRFMAHETGETPVLLLDDVMSELDRTRGCDLLQRVDSGSQVIITASDLALYPQEFLARALLWQVHNGAIVA